MSVTGNITGGNILGGANVNATTHTGTTVSVTGNITGGNLSVTGIAGTLSTAAQTNITSVGTLTSLAVTGNITGGNILGGANVNATTHTGATVSVTGNITGGNILGGANVNATTHTGATVSVTGNITGGNISVTGIAGTLSTATQGSVTSVGTLTGLTLSGNVNMGSRNINSLAEPVAATDAATKNYVDTTAQGLDPKASVVYASTATLFGNGGTGYTYNNGTSGVGATLTNSGTTAALSIDGSTPTVGDRILVKNEAGAFTINTAQSAAFNGIYTVTTVGTVSVPWVLTRATDFDVGTEMPGAFVFVETGTTNADTGWTCTTNNTITVGTTSITWVQFSGAGTYSAGTGLTLTGTTFSVNASQTQITSVGTLGSLAVTGNITGGNILGGANVNATTHTGSTVSVTGNITGGNISVTGIAGTLSTAAQTNITSVGTLTSLAVTGNITSGNLSGTNIVGTLTTAAQTNITSVGTLTSLAVTGNITSGNLSGTNIVGTLTTAAQTNITSVGTLTSLAVTGNISGGNILGGANVNATTHTGTTVSVSGNITGGNVLVSGVTLATNTISATGNITGGNVLVSGVTLATNTISATGNITGGNVLVSGVALSTNTISAFGNITGGNILGGANVNATTHTGTTVSVTGNITGGNILGGANVNATTHTGTTVSVTSTVTGSQFNGSAAGLTSIPAGNINGAIPIANGGTAATNGYKLFAAEFTSNVSANVDRTVGMYGSYASAAVGTPTGSGILYNFLSGTTGNSDGGQFWQDYTTNNLYLRQRWGGTYGTWLTMLSASNFNSYAPTLTGTGASGSWSINAATATSATSATSATTAGTVTTAAQGNITSVGTLTGLTINNATTAITNAATTGTGNIGASGATFNTVFAKATTAQYADLAEMYTSDAEYEPGTVMDFGGEHEVTISMSSNSDKIAGVVSTNPAHLMNATQPGEHVLAVALTGRVPTRVTGTIWKGAMMVSAGNGQATACATPAIGTVLGKSLEDFSGESGVIQVVVGRL